MYGRSSGEVSGYFRAEKEREGMMTKDEAF